MDIQDELYALTGDMHTPKAVHNRLIAARLIAKNVLGSYSEAAILAVFDHLRIAAELAEPPESYDRELH